MIEMIRKTNEIIIVVYKRKRGNNAFGNVTLNVFPFVDAVKIY